jgi:Zn-dependent metalloprotease
MVESLRKRGDAKTRKMAESLDKLAHRYRLARSLAESSRSFQAATVLEADIEVSPNREVYDGKHKAALPGELIRREGDPPSDDAVVNEAYDGAGNVFDLYADVYRRNSLDGEGMKLISTVHHRRKYNNAFWNGEQMAYGDGDGIVFVKLTVLSIIGHELSHGVVQFSGGLIYRDQSGALNESFADVFGALAEQYTYQQTACEASWLIGESILGPDINGVALRSMKAPGTAYADDLLGTDPQPYHMDLYVNTSQDNGGVHINSGIPNHAFYLLANYLGGNAWEKAGHIWYDTLQTINNPMATFADWADKTVEMARSRFGTGSIEMQMTRRAWKLVGINV